MFLKVWNIYRKTPLFSGEYWENFKYTYFQEHEEFRIALKTRIRIALCAVVFLQYFCYVFVLSFVCLCVVVLYAAHVVFYLFGTLSFFKIILFKIISSLRKAEKQELPRNMLRLTNATAPKNSSLKCFFFQTNAMFFPFLSAFNVVYQDQSENYVGEDDMIDVSIL